MTDIIASADGQTTLNLGTPPTPVPEPLGGLGWVRKLGVAFSRH